MPVFDAYEWESVEAEKVIDITRRHMVDIQVSCTELVHVFGLREEADHDPVRLQIGRQFRFRQVLRGFDQVRIAAAKPFGLRVIHSPRQDGEEISTEKPPVVSLPEPGNLVLKMRQMARAHHMQNRAPVLEPEDGPSFSRYEVDDDDELLFEEEAFEQAKERAEKRKQEAAERKAQQDASQEAQEGASQRPNGEEGVAPPETPKAAE